MFVTLGVAAHVDAGKTTLCERLLLRVGVVRRFGRVDSGESFMDQDAIERARGITIFSQQASFDLRDEDGTALRVTLMDTPGHVDFSGEMERALSVLDACLLVVSCAEGVQSHTVTLFRMLKTRGIPTLIFLSKTDRENADISRAMAELRRVLSPDCALMTAATDEVAEELAARDEALLERHFDGAATRADYIEGARRAFAARGLFPVIAGSAVADVGVDALEKAVACLCRTQYDENAPFSAKVYRVKRADGTRLSVIKALSGSLSAKDEVETLSGAQKANALFSLQGERLTNLPKLLAGDTAAVSGIAARPGEIIGEGARRIEQELVPLMSVRVIPEKGLLPGTLLAHLREMEEEDPLLCVRAAGDVLSVGIMGAVQLEVLSGVLQRRFGDTVSFAPPEVIYKETIAAPTVGIGHYEPLRHYAECWLRLVPTAAGSGVAYESKVSPNDLAVNWHRLIGTHVMEREHPGVLTGSALTDVRVELIAGRSHLKHTEGGDFREATYRAIRNALMQAENVLLEPMVRFELTFSQELLARVTGELLTLGAQTDAPEFDDGEVTLGGSCTAEKFWDYPTKYAQTTRGRGRIVSRFDRYAPCKNQKEIVERIGYSAGADQQNPPGSVFCSHGAGFYVAWDHVKEWAHCEVEL